MGNYSITLRAYIFMNQVMNSMIQLIGSFFKSNFLFFFYFLYRLHLKFLEGADRLKGDVPCVLRRTARDGSPSNNLPPGLTVRTLEFKI